MFLMEQLYNKNLCNLPKKFTLKHNNDVMLTLALKDKYSRSAINCIFQ